MKLVYLIFGIFFLIIGLIGLMLPVIPQVPFFLLALFFFSKSSRRLESWLMKKELYRKYHEMMMKFFHKDHEVKDSSDNS